MTEHFLQRVQALRESWSERREVLRLAASHDYEPQFQLLLTIHRWALEAATQVHNVYGSELALTVTPPPGPGEEPWFQFSLADSFIATFALQERRRMGNSRWHISATITPGPGESSTAVGPERRNGHWTRSRVEDLLLSLLGAYERTLADRPRHSPDPHRRNAST